MTLQLLRYAGNELMRKIEDKNRGIFYGIDDRRVGNEIGREGDVGKVLDVFVVLVDNGCKLLWRIGFVVLGIFRDRDLFFVHPHLDLFFKNVWMLLGIFGDNFRNGGAPASISKELFSFVFELTNCQIPQQLPCASSHGHRDSPCLLVEGGEICWKFLVHVGLLVVGEL